MKNKDYPGAREGYKPETLGKMIDGIRTEQDIEFSKKRRQENYIRRHKRSLKKKGKKHGRSV